MTRVILTLFFILNQANSISIQEIDDFLDGERFQTQKISQTDFADLENELRRLDTGLYRNYKQQLTPIAKLANKKWYHGMLDYLPFAGTAGVCGGIYESAINGSAMSRAYARPILIGSCVVAPAAKLGEYLQDTWTARTENKRWWHRAISKVAMPAVIATAAGLTYWVDPTYSIPAFAGTTISLVNSCFTYLKDECGKNNRVRLTKLDIMRGILNAKKEKLELQQ